MLTVLGLVLGLVVSFRTSSAYERYSEGRKLWSDLTLTSRNIGFNVRYLVSHRFVGKDAQPFVFTDLAPRFT